MRTSLLPLFFLVVACSSKGSATVGECPDGQIEDDDGNCVNDNFAEADADADADADVDADDCEIEVEDAEPRNGEGDVNWQSPITFFLDGDDPTATISVKDDSGSTIDGSVENNDGVVEFTATTGLTPDSEHFATINWCGGTEEINFSVSNLGAPLEIDITDETFALDLSTATWVKPSGIDTFIGDALDIKVLMGIEEATETLDFVGALAESGGTSQDMCVPTLDFDPIDFSRSPYFEVGPVDMPISLMGFSITVWSMNISGTFQPDGTGISGVGLSGSLDIREIGPALGESLPIDLSDPDDACDTLILLGIECEACPDEDASPYCLGLILTDIEAEATGEAVEVIEEAYTHEECDESGR